MEVHRVAVRALVEFTLHGEDITPGGSIRDMLDGTLGHKARQASLGEGWRSEVPLSLSYEADDELTVEVHGRMDAFREGEPPLIEEIKLWQDGKPPEAPVEAHRMQAVCYAHMLCAAENRPSAAIRVAYVRRSGAVVAAFDEELTAEECREAFLGLLLPYLRRLQTIRRHIRARDASLQALMEDYSRQLQESSDAYALMGQLAEELGMEQAEEPSTFSADTAEAALVQAVTALEEGAVSDVIRTESGFYVAIRCPVDSAALARAWFSQQLLQTRRDAAVTYSRRYHSIDTGAFYSGLLEQRQALAQQFTAER